MQPGNRRHLVGILVTGLSPNWENDMRPVQIQAGALILFCMVCAAVAAQKERIVEQYGIFEIRLEGPSDGNPFVEVGLGAEFRQANRVYFENIQDWRETY